MKVTYIKPEILVTQMKMEAIMTGGTITKDNGSTEVITNGNKAPDGNDWGEAKRMNMWDSWDDEEDW